MTADEIDRGLRDLGLANAETLRSLQRLADLAPKQSRPSYDTGTVGHTAGSSISDAKLESSS
jgi:hypothetical protein